MTKKQWTTGEKHHRAKLSDETISLLREDLKRRAKLVSMARGLSDKVLAVKYGCSERYVRLISTGRARKIIKDKSLQM